MRVTLVIIWLLILNAAGFIMMSMDKRKAKRDAWRIKNSEWIKPAITQVGRKIVVDADLALELAHQNTKRVTYNK